MEMFFPAPWTHESVLWRGLMVTLVALGVLALFALLRWNGSGHTINHNDGVLVLVNGASLLLW